MRCRGLDLGWRRLAGRALFGSPQRDHGDHAARPGRQHAHEPVAGNEAGLFPLGANGVLGPAGPTGELPVGESERLGFGELFCVQVVKAATPVFELYDARPNLRVEHPDFPHDLPEAVRAKAYAFLGERLK